MFLGGRYCYCLLGSSCVGWGGLSQSLGLQMTFEQWSPFPIIIFFSCCSDNIVVVGCIFTKTKTNIKKWRCAIHTSTGVTGSGRSVDLFSFFSVLAKEPLAQYTAFFSPSALGRCVLSLFVSLYFYFLFFSQGYTALEGLRWSVSVLGPVSYPVDRGIVGLSRDPPLRRTRVDLHLTFLLSAWWMRSC